MLVTYVMLLVEREILRHGLEELLGSDGVIGFIFLLVATVVALFTFSNVKSKRNNNKEPRSKEIENDLEKQLKENEAQFEKNSNDPDTVVSRSKLLLDKLRRRGN